MASGMVSVLKSRRLPTMAERRSQQKDRAVPQLSCALCRDRKLKCDKLDPCTNCTSSGVVCVPVYRPRLPRGRHARRARNNASPTAATGPPITPRCRHTSTGEDGTKELFAPGKGSDRGDGGVLGFRIDRLENLVQRGNCCNSNVDLENDGLRKLVSIGRSAGCSFDELSGLPPSVNAGRITPCPSAARCEPWPGLQAISPKRK